MLVNQRNKILINFGIFYFVFSLIMFFGLRVNLKNKFSKESLNEIISGKSAFRDTTTDLCRYQLLGDPKEEGNYVKFEIFCGEDKKAQSTLSLSAIEDKTVDGVIKEYARIMGFNEELLKEQKFTCYLDGKILVDEMKVEIIRPTSTISCNNMVYEK